MYIDLFISSLSLDPDSGNLWHLNGSPEPNGAFLPDRYGSNGRYKDPRGSWGSRGSNGAFLTDRYGSSGRYKHPRGSWGSNGAGTDWGRVSQELHIRRRSTLGRSQRLVSLLHLFLGPQ